MFKNSRWGDFPSLYVVLALILLLILGWAVLAGTSESAGQEDPPATTTTPSTTTTSTQVEPEPTTTAPEPEPEPEPAPTTTVAPPTTTTTTPPIATPPPTEAPQPPQPVAAPPPPPPSGAPCDFPAYIIDRESGGSYTAVNPSSGAGGKYQFMPTTWNNTARHIGRPDLVGVHPASASPGDQDAMACGLLAWQGLSPWAL